MSPSPAPGATTAPPPAVAAAATSETASSYASLRSNTPRSLREPTLSAGAGARLPFWDSSKHHARISSLRTCVTVERVSRSDRGGPGRERKGEERATHYAFSDASIHKCTTCSKDKQGLSCKCAALRRSIPPGEGTKHANKVTTCSHGRQPDLSPYLDLTWRRPSFVGSKCVGMGGSNSSRSMSCATGLSTGSKACRLCFPRPVMMVNSRTTEGSFSAQSRRKRGEMRDGIRGRVRRRGDNLARDGQVSPPQWRRPPLAN